jgi:hypothetical protein
MLFSFDIEGFLGWGFLGSVKRPYVQLSSTDRQKGSGLVAEEWVGRGMDTNIYIACLRQVVAFAPKVIIIAYRQVVAFAPKVIIIACLRQGFCIRKTR